MRLPPDLSFGHAVGAGRRARQDERRRLLAAPRQPLHVLVGPHRRLLPGAVVLRHRPVAGAALPVGALGDREPPGPAVQRPAQDPDAVPDPVRRRDGVRLLPVPAAAGLLQRARAGARAPRARRAPASCARWRPSTQAAFAAQAARAVAPGGGAGRGTTTPAAPTPRPTRARGGRADDAGRARRRREGAHRRGAAARPRPRTPTTSSSRS